MRFATVDEALAFALEQEKKAAAFYGEMAETVHIAGMKRFFREIVAEEEGHARLIESVIAGEDVSFRKTKVFDIALTETLAPVDASADMTVQDALIFAMHAEKNAYLLYTELASLATDAKLRELFENLAQEELHHKSVFETYYDELVHTEN